MHKTLAANSGDNNKRESLPIFVLTAVLRLRARSTPSQIEMLSCIEQISGIQTNRMTVDIVYVLHWNERQLAIVPIDTRRNKKN